MSPEGPEKSKESGLETPRENGELCTRPDPKISSNSEAAGPIPGQWWQISGTQFVSLKTPWIKHHMTLPLPLPALPLTAAASQGGAECSREQWESWAGRSLIYIAARRGPAGWAGYGTPEGPSAPSPTQSSHALGWGPTIVHRMLQSGEIWAEAVPTWGL